MSKYPELQGTESDAVPAILATGSPPISTLFVSMAKRHPEGKDAEYLRWHTLDHRPEQQRLPEILTSLRVVSTPQCRAERAASSPELDAVDHLMTYFFTGIDGLDGFNELSIALRDAGRSPFILPPVQRGVYEVEARSADPSIKIGADVLPWYPIKGVYVLVEDGSVDSQDLLACPGVVGIWSATSVAAEFSNTEAGQKITYLFLDDDPVIVARRLKPLLEERWQKHQITALLAAPFHCIVPYEWDRYQP